MLTALHTRDAFLQELLQAEATEIERRLYLAFPEPNDDQMIQYLRDDMRLENQLFEMALLARGFANHYRRPDPYQVGVIIVGLRHASPGENPWAVMFSANTKPSKNYIKQCGEWWLFEGALKENGHRTLRRILAIHVVGEPRADDVSGPQGVTQITLTPCKICRDRMWAMSLHAPKMVQAKWTPLIVPTTLVKTADYRNLGIRKYFRADELHPFHKEPKAIFSAQAIDD
ncbi:MAG: hypothetical protein WC050_02980 [Candidatus Paceibacterota bacterium]